MSEFEVASFATPDGTNYTVHVTSPPGDIVAPNGFPAADYFPEGAPQAFLDAMAIRYEVFCKEQGCPASVEIDQDDPRSWHWVMYQNNTTPISNRRMSLPSLEKSLAVCCLRIVPPPHEPHPNGFKDPDEPPYIKLGRVATILPARGSGLSKKLCDVVWDWLSKNPEEISPDWNGLVLAHAQVYVTKLYEKQGFRTDPRLGTWPELMIEHAGMWKLIEMNTPGGSNTPADTNIAQQLDTEKVVRAGNDGEDKSGTALTQDTQPKPDVPM